MQELGRHHPLVRRLRALRRDAELRDREGVLVAEGPRLALEALDAAAPIELAVIAPRLGGTPEGSALVERLHLARVPVHTISDAGMDALQDARAPQPIALVVRRGAETFAARLAACAGPPLVVVACGIQDPGNLGALLRTADAAGADVFLVGGRSADPFHPRAVRSSAGSVFRLPPLRTDLATLPAELAARGIRRLATAPAAGSAYDACDYSGPLALFLGSEGGGLAAEILGGADAVVHVPMRASVQSLSVGAAAAVVLFEAARRRRGLAPARA